MALTLTTRTTNAEDRNHQKLNMLEGEVEEFLATSTGEYFDDRLDKQLPAPKNLKLKLEHVSYLQKIIIQSG